MPGDTTAEASTAANPEPVVTKFKTGDEPEFQKPDHDPHGETFAAAAHCTTTCDRCGKTGQVPQDTLEQACEFTPGPERDVVCRDCA